MQKKQDMTTTVNQMMNDISILSLSEFLLIGFEKSDHEFSFNETISIKNIQYELISLIVNEHQDNSYSIYVKMKIVFGFIIVKTQVEFAITMKL